MAKAFDETVTHIIVDRPYAGLTDVVKRLGIQSIMDVPKEIWIIDYQLWIGKTVRVCSRRFRFLVPLYSPANAGPEGETDTDGPPNEILGSGCGTALSSRRGDQGSEALCVFEASPYRVSA